MARIGAEAFSGCSSLKRIAIPESVTDIGKDAFSGCGKDLTLQAAPGSYGESFAKKNGIKYGSLTVCEHSYAAKVKKATAKKNGSIIEKCSKCGDEKKQTTLHAAKNIKLSKTSCVYNGKNQMPAVTVRDSQGKKLDARTDYTVTYPKAAKNIGSYKVKIRLKGNYSGTVTKTYAINPKGTSISGKIMAKAGGFTVKWKKQGKPVSGYQIQYSANKKFPGKTTVTKNIKKNAAAKLTVSKLASNKKYYVRVRTYKTVKGKKYYSSWSKCKQVTTKEETDSFTFYL